jgi:microsomal dipeptidase-like Zn-dependent dipeptidase
MAWTGETPDLGPCLHHTHSPTTDPILIGGRFGLFMALDEDHGSLTDPFFHDWPSAQSVSHQQMHVTMLRRAYEGGLRLMVASATDNQMLDIIWNPAFSLSQGRFALREDFDYKAAVEQFDFIRQFVAANSSWMAIARTPAEARVAIQQNKLAVVLGLEMDELTAEEILKLKQEYGVALVVPVHLVNNSFGGTAAYNTFFNVANFIMNGALIRVWPDDALGFQFPRFPSEYSATVASVPFLGGLLSNLWASLSAWLSDYDTGTAGHRNRVGLTDEYGLRRLMKAGLLIDTAHMSSAATDATLALADRFDVPLVHSHGGKRAGSKPSERGMSDPQFEGLEASGGILGLGTGSDPEEPVTIAKWVDMYLDVAAEGPVALGTDLNGMAKQIAGSEIPLAYPTAAIQKADWTGRSAALSKFQLGNRSFDIEDDGIAHIGMLPDFLAVGRQRAQALGRAREFDQIFHSAHDFIATWEQAARAASGVDNTLPDVPVSRLEVTIETGTDDLKCGGVMIYAIDRVDGEDRIISLPATISQRQVPDATYSLALQLLPGTELRDVDKLRLDYLPVKCDVFDTGDSWNIKRLRVAYNVMDGIGKRGVLTHKRGAPAKRLDRGATWTVYTER